MSYNKAVAEVLKIDLMYVAEVKFDDSPAVFLASAPVGVRRRLGGSSGCMLSVSLAVPENNLSLSKLNSIVASASFAARLQNSISENGGEAVQVLSATVIAITSHPSLAPIKAPDRPDPSIRVYIGILAGMGGTLAILLILSRLERNYKSNNKNTNMQQVYPDPSPETLSLSLARTIPIRSASGSAKVQPWSGEGEEEKQDPSPEHATFKHALKTALVKPRISPSPSSLEVEEDQEDRRRPEKTNAGPVLWL